MTSISDNASTPDPRRWQALGICLIAGAMTLLDVSIVNVALPKMRTGLNASASDLQWIVAGYTLAFGMLLVPGGRLGDARNRRTVFIIGVGLFTLSSAMAGAALTAGWVVIARVFQGMGGGLITPQVTGFIQSMFGGGERGRAFGYFGATVGLSTAAGPLLGGVLVQIGGADFGWRLVFYVNVPIGILLMILAARVLSTSERPERHSLDPVGVALFAAAVLLVLWPLVQGQQGTPLSERPWWLFAPAAGLLVGWLFWERHWRGTGRDTLVDLRLLRVPSYVLGVSLALFYFAGFTSIFLVITLFLQTGLDYTPLEAGASQTPFAFGSAAGAWLSGRLVQNFGRRLTVTGLALVAAGLIAVDLLVPHLHHWVGLSLAPALLVAGFGSGLVISPNTTLTLDEVGSQQSGSGGGVLQTAQRVGSAVGIALVLAQFFAHVVSSHGDYPAALSAALRITVTLVLAALLLGVIDLVRRRRRPSGPRRAAARLTHQDTAEQSD